MPPNVKAAVTDFAVPTFASANAPPPLNVTTSELIIPTSEPPVMVAVVVASYVLLTAVAPVTVNALVVIFAVADGCVKV